MPYSMNANAFHAASECRRQVKKLTNLVKKVKIVEFHYHIWNHNEKCIQLSTNMPGIGSVIREIAVNISEMSTILASFCSVKQYPCGKCFKNSDTRYVILLSNIVSVLIDVFLLPC